MIATVETNVTFAGTSAVLEFGHPVKQAMIFVPALATDTYLTLSMSYDGVTYLNLSMSDGAGSEYDVEIPASRSRVIDMAGCRFITLTGSNAQTCVVYAIAIPY